MCEIVVLGVTVDECDCKSFLFCMLWKTVVVCFGIIIKIHLFVCVFLTITNNPLKTCLSALKTKTAH